ncbi:hypothetical protein [Ruixingdingia sedimenti]|uniref:Gluconate 2-dehydrogenase subunit 3 n=1 Tax=Ruixingdingia sedimenti TaxID=3073604 RepID=A0ABU1F440_9RHOB|nr:hypothetical protein [Xinfangfangia sp. LG-4]MDR5651633.1 hypothetical protein [Xinfangfangia sp. LG-4]
MATLTPQQRAAFGAIADYLIPAYKGLPAATAVGVHEGMVDAVLSYRPDIEEPFLRGLAAVDTGDLSPSLNALFRADADAFNALGLAASGGYYMTAEVRAILGYPGQESLTYDAHATPDYLTDHMLERVVRRGPLYRPTPG